jgi:hypothetical protein
VYRSAVDDFYRIMGYVPEDRRSGRKSLDREGAWILVIMSAEPMSDL